MIIDKSVIIERGLERFPSVYIEGAAACGKSTAVKMFLESHPEATSDVFYMNKETDIEAFTQRIEGIVAGAQGRRFLVFENMGSCQDERFFDLLEQLVEELEDSIKVIFVSREKPPVQLVRLLWHGKMEMVYQLSLMMSLHEVENMTRASGSNVNGEQLYHYTGGWPGCVAAIIAITRAHGELGQMGNFSKIAETYEFRTYLDQEIYSHLSDAEKAMVDFARKMPWVTPDLGAALALEFDRDIYENLQRKGILIFNEGKGRWHLNRLFSFMGNGRFSQQSTLTGEDSDLGQYTKGAVWYEEQGYVGEALGCYEKAGNFEKYQETMIKFFDRIPTKIIEKTDVLTWQGSELELCWLRGIHCYLNQDFSGMRRERQKVQRLKGRLATEIYLNLAFVDPIITVEQWLEILEEKGAEHAPIRLYYFTENTSVLLTGLKDLSELFTCSTREEKRRMKLLKEILGEREYMGIQLAKVDFGYETMKKNLKETEEWQALCAIATDNAETFSWHYQIGCLYLLSKIYGGTKDEEVHKLREELVERLKWEDDESCQNQLVATQRMYDLWDNEEELVTNWLKNTGKMPVFQVTEENYYHLFLQVKGYLLLNQYEYAGRILEKLIPYIHQYHRTRILAELMFQQAIVNWASGKNGDALKNVLESFLYTGKCNYVVFYSSYGPGGRETLELYLEWLRNAEPKKWQRKKKYNHGNVLNLPTEDYLELVMRQAKRNSKSYPGSTVVPSLEKLTLTETMVLQHINKGYTNGQICEAMNLKLPTVKTHISSIFKKLEVSSRVQAMVKAKELGILK